MWWQLDKACWLLSLKLAECVALWDEPEREKSSSKQWHEGKKSNNSVGYYFWTYNLCNPSRRRMCTWRVFIPIWSPVLQQLASLPGLKTGRDYSAVVLNCSQVPPSSLLLFCTGMLGGGWERGYISLARLPQQLHEQQHALLSLMSGRTQPVLFFALLLQQHRVLSRSILHFSLRLLGCFHGSLWEHDCAISTTPEASLHEQLPLRFTLGTWLWEIQVVYFQIFHNATSVIQQIQNLRYDVQIHMYIHIHTYRHHLCSTR